MYNVGENNCKKDNSNFKSKNVKLTFSDGDGDSCDFLEDDELGVGVRLVGSPTVSSCSSWTKVDGFSRLLESADSESSMEL